MKKSHRPWVSAFALTCIVTPALAQTGPREEERAALYREGLSLAETGRWEEALRKFQAVVAIRSAPRALLALATAQDKAGHLVDAKKTYDQTRADAQAAKDAELVKKASAALAALEPRMPHLTIRLAPGTTGAEVSVDDAPRPTAETFEVDPGEHRVVVRAPGMRPFEERFRVFEREPKEISVTLFAEEPTPPAEVAPAPPTVLPEHGSEWSGPPLPAIVLGGAGVAAMVTGFVVRANGQAAYDDATAACRDGRCTSAEAVDNGNSARGRMVAGTVVSVVGGLAVVGAGVWWLLSSDTSRRASVSGPLRARLDASPATNGGWVGVSGSF
jgi:hypothetical protein